MNDAEFKLGDVVVHIGTPGKYVVEGTIMKGLCFMSIDQLKKEPRIGFFVDPNEFNQYVKTGTRWDFKERKEVEDD